MPFGNPISYAKCLIFALAAASSSIPSAHAALSQPADPSHTITVGWNAVPEQISGYKVYVGNQSRQYDRILDAGQVLTTQIDQLGYGQTYYVAVRAIGSTGLESEYSAEIMFTTPSGQTGGPLIANGSFESDFSGWSYEGNVLVKSGTMYPATDGAKVVAFNGSNAAPGGSLSQTFTTVPGQAHTLTFDAGPLNYNKAEQVLEVSVTGNDSLLSKTIIMKGTASGVIDWQNHSLPFIADGTSATLTFRDLSSTTEGIDLILDKVSVTAIAAGTVPPPLPISISIASNGESGAPGLRWSYPAAAMDASHQFTIQASEDMVTWTDIDTVSPVDSIAGADGTVHFEWPIEMTGKKQMFYRLGAENSAGESVLD